MNKQETIEALKQGLKVSHYLLLSGQWFEQDGNDIKDEQGYILRNFWYYRRSDIFEAGWSIYKPIN